MKFIGILGLFLFMTSCATTGTGPRPASWESDTSWVNVNNAGVDKSNTVQADDAILADQKINEINEINAAKDNEQELKDISESAQQQATFFSRY
ncbi:MAG: hypothetical protein WC627_02470 [Legionella sp.]|jgi:hypothetical protein